MAVTQEPLLRSPGRGTHAAWKLAFFISLIAVLSLAAVVTHQIAATRNQAPLQRPAELCSASPNQATCLQIISGGAASEHVNPRHVLRRLLGRSAREVASAAVAAAEIGRRAGEPRERAAMADCLELLDLSAVRVQQSASSALTGSEEDDARTWISASLTNYGTCLDGLPESAMRSEMEALLRPLMETASAYLAVLNAVSRSPVAAEEATAADFPSWLSARDRKLLTATSAGGIVADAVVAKDGSGRFLTVQEAVDAAPEKSQSRYVIYVKKGIYKENVSVGKRKINLMIVGDGADATVISGSLNVVDGSTTFNSATLAAVGDGFILQDLCVENTAGPEKHQAVALRVGADKSVINRCKIEGYQDTLYTHSLRQFFRDSTISGTVDFIFGNAAVVIQNCELVARRAMAGQKNAVTAQGRTDPNQNTGTSIQRCRVVASGDLANANGTIPTFLGRPWKEYSRTVYMQSYIGDHIAAAGWLEWSGSFALNTLFYGEYKNEGPGARTESRVKWEGYHRITDPAVARAFTVVELIQGGSWLPSTGIPFTEGL